MHQPANQEDQDPLTMAESSSMLKESDPSSTCLLCHAEAGKHYNVLSRDGSMYVPGGDFYWLKKTFTWIEKSQSGRSEGDKHGHNIIASDYGINADFRLHTAPGGNYPSYALGCISCHDPHATSGDEMIDSSLYTEPELNEFISDTLSVSGNYRLLGGIGYKGGKEGNGVPFSYPAPVALSNTNNWTESDYNHPAYGAGMSEWCSNCHYDMLFGDSKHPSGNYAKLSGQIISNYNSYIKTGDITGIQSNAYLSLVPFELGIDNKSLLDPSSSSGPGVTGNENVMCLTCHRSHASAFEGMGRWDFKATFISDSHPKAGDSGVTGNDVLNSYYGRDMVSEFGKYQRQFCNKCHIQD